MSVFSPIEIIIIIISIFSPLDELIKNTINNFIRLDNADVESYWIRNDQLMVRYGERMAFGLKINNNSHDGWM